jgi:dTDP-4-amino-4,6-dideoxy-D-glucose acyltransferase
MAFLGRQALRKLGFAALGTDVSVSDRASIYGAPRIALGSHVRIDDFSILSAGAEGIRIGSYIHIACYCSLIGKALIEVGDLSTLSSRVTVYSSSDDYTGAGLTNPMLPLQYRRVTDAPVRIGRHVIVGSGSVILPGVTIGEGAAVGALTLVNRSLDPFALYAGVPARRLRDRSKAFLELEAQWRVTAPPTPATSRRRRSRGRG